MNPNDRNQNDGRNAYNIKETSSEPALCDGAGARVVPETIASTVEHRRQLRGVINRLTIGADGRETLREVIDESR